MDTANSSVDSSELVTNSFRVFGVVCLSLFFICMFAFLINLVMVYH